MINLGGGYRLYMNSYLRGIYTLENLGRFMTITKAKKKTGVVRDGTAHSSQDSLLCIK